MIELVVLNYLQKHLACPVYMEVPSAKDMPERFYIVEKLGSGESNHLYTASFALQSYGATLYDSALMNDQLKKVMENFIELDEITRCKLNTDYPFNNVSIKRYRYQAVYNITHY